MGIKKGGGRIDELTPGVIVKNKVGVYLEIVTNKGENASVWISSALLMEMGLIEPGPVDKDSILRGAYNLKPMKKITLLVE